MRAETLPETPHSPLPDIFLRWFSARGWQPRKHQLDLLEKAQANRSALLIAPTGAGKTLAGFLPTLVELSQPKSKRISTGRTDVLQAHFRHI